MRHEFRIVGLQSQYRIKKVTLHNEYIIFELSISPKMVLMQDNHSKSQVTTNFQTTTRGPQFT